MKYLLIILCSSYMLQAVEFYFDKAPSKVLRKDLKTVRAFDKLAYEISEAEAAKPIDVAEVYNYIWTHREHAEDYTRLKIDTVGTVGYRTPRGETNNNALINEENYNYYKIGLAATYNLYDGKTAKDIQNKKLEYRSKIITIVEKYSTCKAETTALNLTLKLKRLEQIRSKVMVKTAQKYLDERLKVIEELLKLRIDLNKKQIICRASKLHLLALVQPAAQKDLESLL